MPMYLWEESVYFMFSNHEENIETDLKGIVFNVSHFMCFVVMQNSRNFTCLKQVYLSFDFVDIKML